MRISTERLAESLFSINPTTGFYSGRLFSDGDWENNRDCAVVALSNLLKLKGYSDRFIRRLQGNYINSLDFDESFGAVKTLELGRIIGGLFNNKRRTVLFLSPNSIDQIPEDKKDYVSILSKHQRVRLPALILACNGNRDSHLLVFTEDNGKPYFIDSDGEFLDISSYLPNVCGIVEIKALRKRSQGK